MKSIFSVAVIFAFAVSSVCMTGCSEPVTPSDAVEAVTEAGSDMKDKAEEMGDKAMEMKDAATEVKDKAMGGSGAK